MATTAIIENVDVKGDDKAEPCLSNYNANDCLGVTEDKGNCTETSVKVCIS